MAVQILTMGLWLTIVSFIYLKTPFFMNLFGGNMDELLTPAGSSAAEEIAKLIPEARVVKGFNTTFAATLATKSVAGKETTTVQLASDDQEAKDIVAGYIQEGGLNTIDAGALKRARELEAMGFLQITLAAREQLNWTAGFAVIK